MKNRVAYKKCVIWDDRRWLAIHLKVVGNNLIGNIFLCALFHLLDRMYPGTTFSAYFTYFNYFVQHVFIIVESWRKYRKKLCISDYWGYVIGRRFRGYKLERFREFFGRSRMFIPHKSYFWGYPRIHERLIKKYTKLSKFKNQKFSENFHHSRNLISPGF